MTKWERRSRKPLSASIRLMPASNPPLNRGPRIRITRKGENMNFGQALEALKVDKRVARAEWNGKGMWLRLVHSEDVRTCSDFWGEEVNADPPCLLPWIGMKTADYRFVPWLASQTDMLAEDWEIIE